MKFIAIENRPSDSRAKIIEDDVCQTLTGRMGTGVNNGPMIIEIHNTGEGYGEDNTDRKKIL